MPLCSAVYWCFCHVVKIYGAISLAWNGLTEVSSLVDLWHNVSQRKQVKKKKLQTHKSLNDVHCHFPQITQQRVAALQSHLTAVWCLWWALLLNFDNLLWCLGWSTAPNHALWYLPKVIDMQRGAGSVFVFSVEIRSEEGRPIGWWVSFWVSSSCWFKEVLLGHKGSVTPVVSLT